MASNSNAAKMSGPMAAAARAHTIYVVIVMLLLIGLWSYILNYFNTLDDKGCKCALTNRRTILQVCLTIFIIASILSIVVTVGMMRGAIKATPALASAMVVLALVQFAATLTFIFVTWKYLASMKSADCQCAQTTGFKVLQVVNIVQIVMLVLSAIFFIISMFSIFAATR